MNELFLAAVLLCQTHTKHVGIESEVKLPAIQINGVTKWTQHMAYKNGAACTIIVSSDGELYVQFRDTDGTPVAGHAKEAPKALAR